MSSSEETPQQGKQVKILIVAKNVSGFSATARFLSRRGFPTQVVGEVKQAVEYVVRQRPSFVMISYSHSNLNVLKLPQLLMSTFNVTCIAFGENNDPKTIARLHGSKMQHVFFGVLSGPVIHMKIKQILTEMNGLNSAGKGARKFRHAAADVLSYGDSQKDPQNTPEGRSEHPDDENAMAYWGKKGRNRTRLDKTSELPDPSAPGLGLGAQAEEASEDSDDLFSNEDEDLFLGSQIERTSEDGETTDEQEENDLELDPDSEDFMDADVFAEEQALLDSVQDDILGGEESHQEHAGNIDLEDVFFAATDSLITNPDEQGTIAFEQGEDEDSSFAHIDSEKSAKKRFEEEAALFPKVETDNISDQADSEIPDAFFKMLEKSSKNKNKGFAYNPKNQNTEHRNHQGNLSDQEEMDTNFSDSAAGESRDSSHEGEHEGHPDDQDHHHDEQRECRPAQLAQPDQP